ncbi:MAG: response regulator [Cyanobacteria bacterium J06597_1]
MPKILIVEDEERLAALLVRGLQKDGYTTQVAASGDTALELILSGAFELCLLDLMMPVMSGLDVLQSVREQGITTPILVLSALADRETQETCLAFGANDFIGKPFSISLLRDRVRRLLAPS